jgi:hypothetical protein
MERSAHDLTATRFCREQGCEEVSVTGDRGRYANLCEEHLDAAKRRTNGAAPAARPTPAAVGDPSASYEQRVRALVGHAKQVDKAIKKAAVARKAVQPQLEKAQKAKDAATDSIEAFKAAVRQLAS